MARERKGIRQTFLDTTAKGLLGFLTILVFSMVVFRYIFGLAFRWSEELTNYIFIYMVALGIAIAYRFDDHIFVSIVYGRFPERIRHGISILIHIVNGVLMITISVLSFPVMFGKIGHTLTPGLQIPRAYLYAAIPIGTLSLVFEIILKLRRTIKRSHET